MSLLIEVASLLQRPRHLSPGRSEDFYRRSEALAFGIDMALSERGVKRTSLIAQKVNRVAFSEVLEAPAMDDAYVVKILELDGVEIPEGLGGEELRRAIAQGEVKTRFAHLLGHTEAPWYYVPREFALPIWIAEPAAQVSPGGAFASGTLLSLGSVARLRDELQLLATLLQERGADSADLLPEALLEAADFSMETGLPITVSGEET